MRALISTVAVIAAAATRYLLDVSDAVAQQPVKPPSNHSEGFGMP
jgi:hypothetical protein